MFDGLARVVRNETPGLSLRSFHAGEASASSATHLAQLIKRAFDSKTEDDEYRLQDGLLHTSRIEEDTALNSDISSLLPGGTKSISMLPLKQIPYPVKLHVRSPGMLDSICMEPDESAESELQAGFVEIEVKATALK